ncbi:hypothetical protein [Acidithiobacillus ferriphilus]|jgi:hypothetical protein|uniref:hypothetical protein n=1 Tax=Acidithiobacillus ferriphilus TaxID=1689834 RepID=UPI00232C68EE|nr:hypothetical protein [Acidithiobacillus ferriphilus]WCE94184.1 hypothetical protein PJU76_01175 [Acidithiobacillus ferriphilus]
MPAKILFLLFALTLSGCASLPPSSSSNATASAAARGTALANRNSETAQQRLAAVAAQRAEAAQQFCPNWQQALDHARSNATGCAQMPTNEQATCWQAVSQWAQEESRYFHALAPLLQSGAYASPAAQAAHFFDLTQGWAITCQNGQRACAAASGHQQMDNSKSAINQFCRR